MLVLKDVLDLVQNLLLQGGGKSSNQTSTLQTITRAIQVIVTMFLDSIMNYYLNFAI